MRTPPLFFFWLLFLAKGKGLHIDIALMMKWDEGEVGAIGKGRVGSVWGARGEGLGGGGRS